MLLQTHGNIKSRAFNSTEGVAAMIYDAKVPPHSTTLLNCLLI